MFVIFSTRQSTAFCNFAKCECRQLAKVTFGEITERLSFSGLNNNINYLKLILKILTRFVLSKLRFNIAPITNNPNITVHHFGKKKNYHMLPRAIIPAVRNGVLLP